MGDRAGLWYRVSGSGQDEEGQLPALHAWCAERGYDVRRLYRLHGVSASKGEQQAAQDRVLADVRAGEISVLVVVRVDRIERRKAAVRRVFNFLGDVRDAGGRVEFTAQTYLNVEGPQADVMLANLASMAAEEARIKKERSAEGRARTLELGGALHHPPFGYRAEGPKRNKRFVPTSEEEVGLVITVFERIASGDSLNAVARDVLWSPAGIAGMIRNSTYMGLVTGQSGPLAGQIIFRCEPLVDADLWDRANRALSDRARKQRGPRTKAPLAGVLRCEDCDAPCYRTHQERGESGAEYKCSGQPSCGRVRAQAAENALLGLLEKIVLDAPVIERAFIPGRNYEAEIKTLHYEERRLGLLGLDEETEDARRAELRSQRKALEALPVVEDRWEEQLTGRTYRDEWNVLERSEWSTWLKSYGFKVTTDRKSIVLIMPLGDGFRAKI